MCRFLNCVKSKLNICLFSFTYIAVVRNCLRLTLLRRLCFSKQCSYFSTATKALFLIFALKPRLLRVYNCAFKKRVYLNVVICRSVGLNLKIPRMPSMGGDGAVSVHKRMGTHLQFVKQLKLCQVLSPSVLFN